MLSVDIYLNQDQFFYLWMWLHYVVVLYKLAYAILMIADDLVFHVLYVLPCFLHLCYDSYNVKIKLCYGFSRCFFALKDICFEQK